VAKKQEYEQKQRVEGKLFLLRRNIITKEKVEKRIE